MRSIIFLGSSRIITSLFCIIILSSFWNESGPGIDTVSAEVSDKPRLTSELSIYDQRRNLYEEIEILTQIPWYWIAALDQYERSITPRKEIKKENRRLAGIRFKEKMWAGPFNPNLDDKNPKTIALFGGIGQDATADGSADPENDRDSLYSMVSHLMRLGHRDEDLRIALWRYYQNDSAVSRIWQFAKIYKAFGKVDLSDSAFPLPVKSNYTYRDTWGARRGWGGLRIHEGTDLFAGSGVPVRSVCYGVVETKGWNPYGGWRMGIRDLNNRYHYYAHLHGYEKKIEIGDIVKPGQTIGWVGSSGYGPPGTQGKFPPHLHYGIYQDTGSTEWAFDPYPLLKRWENLERKQTTKRATP